MSKFHWFSFHRHISFYDVCVVRMHAKLDADVELKILRKLILDLRSTFAFNSSVKMFVKQKCQNVMELQPPHYELLLFFSLTCVTTIFLVFARKNEKM